MEAARGWQVAAVVAIVVALGALGVAIVALNRKQSTPVAAHAANEAQIVSLGSELAGVRATAEQAREEAKKVTGTVSKITTCIPELTGEINGLTAEVSGGSVFLSQHNQVSSYCSSTLEKH